jgi:autotransporter-associated beta strand protein
VQAELKCQKGSASVVYGEENKFIYIIILRYKITIFATYSTLYLADGCTVSNVAKSFTIGKLTSKGRLIQPIADFTSQAVVNGSNTWNVVNSFATDGDFTFDGIFSDDGGSNKCIFNKVGTCTMTVTGKSTHSGATTVSAGTLQLSSGATVGTGELTIAKGATFLGITPSGVTLTNSKVTVNGTLQAGAKANSTTGMLDFGGKNVTFNKGSVYQLVARRCASAKKSSSGNGCAMIDNVGTLRINGTISVQLPSSHSLEAGDSVRIFSARSVSGTPTFDLPTIEGLEWDTSHWKEGYLHLKTATGIDAAHLPDTPVSVAIYTASGCHITTLNCLRSEVESTVAANTAILPGLCILYIRSKKVGELVKLIK